MASAAAAAAAAPLFELGLIADCQHGDKPAANGRTYRESLHRLALAVEHLNEFDDLHAVLHLGDVIDGRETLDDSLQDLSNVLGVMQRLHPRLHEQVLHAVGNHDLAVPRAQLREALGLADSGTFFSTAVRGAVGWRIVMLDTYQISTSWVKQGRQPPSIAADRWLEEHAERPNALDWNGAVGEEQRQWLSETLDAAGSVGDRVLVFGHSPLLPGASDAVHCAWDGAETAAILGMYSCKPPAASLLHNRTPGPRACNAIAQALSGWLTSLPSEVQRPCVLCSFHTCM